MAQVSLFMARDARRDGYEERKAILRRELLASESDDSTSSSLEEYESRDYSDIEGTSSEGEIERDSSESALEIGNKKEKEEKTRNSFRPPARVNVDGNVFRLRKKWNGKQYWYCVESKCPAGLVFDENTRVWKVNGKPHSHSVDIVNTSQMQRNQEEIALRLFVHEHFGMDSHEIYSLLLRKEFRNEPRYQHLPPLNTIDMKRIQNIKTLLIGTTGRDVLRSMLPPAIAELDGKQFLRFQSVEPIMLIFATGDALDTVDNTRLLMLKRLNLRGKAIQFVYSVYTVGEQCVRPAVWILSSERPSLVWIHLKAMLDGRLQKKSMGMLPKTWIAPCTGNYMAILKRLLHPDDAVIGIEASYINKVRKITSQIHGLETRGELTELFLDLRTAESATLERVLETARQKHQSNDATEAFTAWESRFKNQSFMIHSVNMCCNEMVSFVYQTEKNRPMKNFETDMDLVRQIHDLGQGLEIE